jgi:RNA polymerase sigma-70 factor, ECF subfamily
MNSIDHTINGFLSRIERKAYMMALLATQNHDDALDILQDAMIKLVQKYTHKSHDEWPKLFHTILQNQIYQWYRKHVLKLKWFWQSDAAYDEEESFMEKQPGVKYDEPDWIVEQSSTHKKVMALLKSLPMRQQQTFLLREWEGYDIAETAVILQCSESSVKTHYTRAKDRLRHLMAETDHAQ